jgi:hypothetical protein
MAGCGEGSSAMHVDQKSSGPLATCCWILRSDNLRLHLLLRCVDCLRRYLSVCERFYSVGYHDGPRLFHREQCCSSNLEWNLESEKHEQCDDWAIPVLHKVLDERQHEKDFRFLLCVRDWYCKCLSNLLRWLDDSKRLVARCEILIH